MNKTIKGFTLAEVLITIGIIGFVAAVILPAVRTKIDEQMMYSSNKKARSLLLNAFKKAAYDNGGSLDGMDLGSELGNYAKLLKNCNTDTKDRYACWHDNNVAKIAQKTATGVDYKYFAGKTTGSVITMDGMFVMLAKGALNCNKGESDSTCYHVTSSNGYCGTFYVDINGKKNPNTWGQDIKLVYFWADGYVKYYGDKTASGHPTYTATRILEDTTQYTEPTGQCYDPNNYSYESYD